MKVGVIFGGRSSEYEVSIRSAASIIREIDKSKYEAIPIGITKDGAWLNPFESADLFSDEIKKLLNRNEGDGWEREEIAFLGDTRYRGITRINVREEKERVRDLDVVFPVLHGSYGEDGSIQGLFEMAGVPYVGCGVLASSCGMDKVVMKRLFREAGLPVCEYVWFLRNEWEKNREAAIRQVEEKLGYPCFVKPSNLGSSVGVMKAMDRETLKKGVEVAAEYSRKIVIEECLDMREIECGLIGNEELQASLPGEYVIYDEDKKFLDYIEKYEDTGNNRFIAPALVSAELTKKIQEMAIEAFRAIGGSGFARVDFFLRKDTGRLLLNEINTIPGLTEVSGFPKMWEGTGMKFSVVIDSLIKLAMKRHEDKLRNKV